MGPSPDEVKKSLFDYAMKGNWADVIAIYKTHQFSHDAVITKTKDTALHVAVADGQDSAVEELVRIVKTRSLGIQNEAGNTVLHLAADLGSEPMCRCIAKKDGTLMAKRNNENLTPLFLTVLNGRKDAYSCLTELCKDEELPQRLEYCRGKDGETILHSAIDAEYFGMAHQIIQDYETLPIKVDEKGFSPHHVLASKPSAFRSGTHYRWFNKVIYKCIFIDELDGRDDPFTKNLRYDHEKSNYPENYQTCVGIISYLRQVAGIMLPSDCWRQDEEMPKEQDVKSKKAQNLLPENYTTCFNFLKFFSKVMLVFLGLGSTQVEKIRNDKRKHTWSVRIMQELLDKAQAYEYEYDGAKPTDDKTVGWFELHQAPPEDSEMDDIAEKKETLEAIPELFSTPIIFKLVGEGKVKIEIKRDNDADEKKEMKRENDGSTVLLTAAKNGVKEIVEEILVRFPMAINDINKNKKNIVLLAVENRQPHIYKLLESRRKIKKDDNLFRKIDEDGNNALHLAAKMSEHRPWLLPGAALQLQWELKWYEYVKKSIPSNYFGRHNHEGKTPAEIFNRDHMKLSEQAGEWMKDTSQSCSVVAALIATVAFATSATVPGGVKQDLGLADVGTPTLINKPAFCVFAIASLVALCFSLTSVVMFLAILTSRKQDKDFGKKLPNMLLYGLTSLFVSIGAMLLSFCAGHFFVLQEKLRYAAVPMYAVTCLPVTIFAFAQFGLYFDLFMATLKSLPLRSVS